jgi:1-acyl-sn-glycerol-3-phosphate acyltransferase
MHERQSVTRSGRGDVRFVAEHPHDARRIAIGSRLLIGAAAPVLGAAASLGGPALGRMATRVWARATARLLRLEIVTTGLERLDPKDQYVVVSLHEGFADALALLRLPLRLRFATRDELFASPHLGGYLAATEQIRVDEGGTTASLRRFYREVAAAFASGDSLVVFAQGSVLGIEVAFLPGAMRIASRFGHPVLPIVLTGSHRVWEHPYSPIVRLDQTMAMHVLPPIRAQRFGPIEARNLEREMKRLALAQSDAPVRRFVPERDGWWDDYRYAIDPDFPDVASQVAAHRASIGRGGSSD